MRLLDLTLPEAVDNLALDEALLLEAEAGRGGEVLRLWEWPAPAVVLGSGGRLAEDVDEAACAADGVPVLRRSSGGGTVLLGRGCLLYSLVLPYEHDPALAEIQSSYRFILGRVGAALGAGPVGRASRPAPGGTPGPPAGRGAGIEQAGISDLAVAGRKFSGNAQQRKRHHLLHHGSLLYAFDLERVGRYLRLPPRQPEYRAGRGHGEFLMNYPLTRGELRRRLCEAWGAEAEGGSWPEEEVRRLVRERYGSPEWVRRR